LAALQFGRGHRFFKVGHIGHLDHEVVASLILLRGYEVHFCNFRGAPAGFIGKTHAHIVLFARTGVFVLRNFQAIHHGAHHAGKRRGGNPQVRSLFTIHRQPQFGFAQIAAAGDIHGTGDALE